MVNYNFWLVTFWVNDIEASAIFYGTEKQLQYYCTAKLEAFAYGRITTQQADTAEKLGIDINLLVD